MNATESTPASFARHYRRVFGSNSADGVEMSQVAGGPDLVAVINPAWPDPATYRATEGVPVLARFADGYAAMDPERDAEVCKALEDAGAFVGLGWGLADDPDDTTVLEEL